MNTIEALYGDMVNCQACSLRAMCTQVVPGTGNIVNPTLMIVGEAPGQQEDEEGEPFVGMAGQVLRKSIRATGIINRNNTIITNTMKCRPPGNKFPTDDSPSICVGKWLMNEIKIAKPKRLLLLGSTPLKYVAGMKGITAIRGKWMECHGIRTMATFHPSYVIRQDNQGDMETKRLFDNDIVMVAEEVKELIGGSM